MLTNHRLLAERFLDRLLGLRPRSVLDVGCGRGQLLSRCRAAGVPALGIEPHPPAEAEGGILRIRGDASHLPLADGAVDWVTLRHVPHHLERLPEALAEAWRVAREGLLLAEPWFDLELPSQRLGLEVDRWLKRQDRRRGLFHGDCLGADELLEALRARPARVALERYTAQSPFTATDLEERARESLAGLSPSIEERERWQALLEAASSDLITQNGTLILTCWKRRGIRTVDGSNFGQDSPEELSPPADAGP